MPRCAGKKRDGSRCTTIVTTESGFCYQHDPGRAAERQRNARKAARGPRTTAELRALKEDLRTLIADVRAGRLDRNAAAVIIQAMNTMLRAIALEREVKETEVLAAEIAELKREYAEGYTG
jgi:hypothetical protein